MVNNLRPAMFQWILKLRAYLKTKSAFVAPQYNLRFWSITFAPVLYLKRRRRVITQLWHTKAVVCQIRCI